MKSCTSLYRIPFRTPPPNDRNGERALRSVLLRKNQINFLIAIAHCVSYGVCVYAAFVLFACDAHIRYVIFVSRFPALCKRCVAAQPTNAKCVNTVSILVRCRTEYKLSRFGHAWSHRMQRSGNPSAADGDLVSRIQMFDSMSFECVLRVKVPSSKTPLVVNRFDKCFRIKMFPFSDHATQFSERYSYNTAHRWQCPIPNASDEDFSNLFSVKISRNAFTELFRRSSAPSMFDRRYQLKRQLRRQYAFWHRIRNAVHTAATVKH